MRIFLTFSMLMVLWSPLKSQIIPNTIPECGTDEILVRNPFLYAERVGCAPEVDLDTAQVLTIPVVVHVVHLGEPVGEGTNISDEQILSCIENLNHRFRGDVEALAALTDEYDEYELSLVMDSKIEFCLAQRDPDNNPTNGIHRYNGSSLTNNGESYALDGVANGNGGFTDGISETYMKETVGCWDTQKYFNLWVVSEINGNNGGNGIQGYSYLGPTGNNCLYGPVCLYNVFGTTGNLKASFNLNATTTHEVGHAFGLYHTFSNQGSDPCSETNGCTQGDQCPDTPPTSANNIGCTTVDCPDAMIENYMDYTPQTCRIAFTQNQIERMRDQIWNDITGLVYDNIKCQPLNGLDLAITNVTLPSSWCQDQVSFSIKISNYGGNDVSGASLLLNGVTYSLPPISAGEFTTIGLTDFELGDGYFDIEIIYPEDQYIENNSVSVYVEPSDENWVEVVLSPDVWSNEIDWEITDENGEIVLSGGNYPFGSNNIDFYEGACLPYGCYTFTITDTNGDGMCAFDLNGDGICDNSYDAFINIISNNNLIFDLSDPSEIDFGSILTHDFCIADCPTSDCPWDLDNDGVVDVYDLMVFLSYNGLQGECLPADFNFSGGVDSQDLITMINNFGYDCFTGEFIDGVIVPDWVWSYLDVTEVTENIGDIEKVCLLGPPMYFDLLGKKVNGKGRLAPGVYLVVEKWSNGQVTSRKEFRMQ